MAKNKRPFSTLLDNPETTKAVQDALHAPAQLPTKGLAPAQLTHEPAADNKSQKLKPGPKPKADKEEYTVTHVKTSLHKFLKLASAHYGMEVREITSEAVAAHPKVKEMIKKFS